MRTLMPITGPMTLRREMDRLFDRLWNGEGLEPQMRGEWDPIMDLVENKEAFVATLELPGLDLQDVQVTMQNGMLTVKGQKQREKEEKDERHYRMERSWGAFVRTVQIPVQVDETKIDARFKNGVLTVRLPKTAEARGTNVPIHT